MQRRRVLQLFGGVAVGLLPGVATARQRGDRVAIVGGGIIGASIAYHLARRGAEVRLLEKDAPAAGATSRSFAWMNAGASKRPLHYYQLNRLGMLGYRHLERELDGAFSPQWGGSLRWYADAEPGARLRHQVGLQQAQGYPVHLVDEAEFTQLAPGVVPGPVSAASWAEQDGSVDPVLVTQALLTSARALGATIEHPCEVTALDLEWSRLRAFAPPQAISRRMSS